MKPETDGSETYYTQFNSWVYKGVINTVNYSVSRKIPINTQIEIERVSGKKISFHTTNDPSVSYTLINEEGYTGTNTSGLKAIYFQDTPVDLSVFTNKEREFIMNFEKDFISGISKEAVIAARGYPPKHRTPSTINSDSWVYWHDRWTAFELAFTNDLTYAINGEPLSTSLFDDGRGSDPTQSVSQVKYTKGMVTIPWFGFYLYLTGTGKIYVVDREPGSSAAKYLLEGDRLVAIGTRDIDTLSDVFAAQYDLFPGQAVTITIERDDKRQDFRISTGNKEVVSHVKELTLSCIKRDYVNVAVIVDSVEFSNLNNMGESATAVDSLRRSAMTDLQSLEETFLLNQFSEFDNFRLIDRARIERVVEEQKLGLTGLAEDAATIGKLLGASHIMFASMTRSLNDSGAYQDSIVERLVEVETGQVVSASTKVYSETIEATPDEEPSSFFRKLGNLFSSN